MSFRAAASVVISAVAVTAVIAATTADGPAGAGRRPPAGRSASSSGSGTRPGLQLCNVVDEVERLSVVRTDAFPQNGFTFSFPERIGVRSAADARGVAHALCALPVVAPGTVLHCPIDFGITYRLVFTRTTGGSVRPVTLDATGCQFVDGAGPGARRRTATRALWATLGRAMGLEHPTNTTFRGSQRTP